MANEERRTEYVSFRLTKANLEALDRLGAETNTTRSNMCWLLLAASLNGMSAHDFNADRLR